MSRANVHKEPLFIGRVERIMKGINSFFVVLAALLITAMVVIIVQEVIRRYFFNSPSTWALDIARFLLVYVFFLAIAPALESGAHVSTDMITAKLSAKGQWFFKLVAFLLTAIYGVVLFWQVLQPTLSAFATNRLFPVAVEIPMKYVYMIAPIGALQFIFTSLVCFLLTFYRERDGVEESQVLHH